MGSSDKFCLRWNDFESNISVAFREIREEKDLFDCTLSCGSRQIQAHKLILAACSPFFRNIFKQNPHQHPLLYLKGVKFTDLQSVLAFMYHGEVNVAQEELNSFLAIAEELEVKGLTQVNSGPAKNTKSTTANDIPSLKPKLFKEPLQSVAKNLKTLPVQHQSKVSYNHQDNTDDDIQEILPIVKTEPEPASMHSSNIQQASGSMENMDMQLAGMESYVADDEDYGGYDDMGGQVYDAVDYQNYDNTDVVGAYAEKLETGKYACKLCGFITRDKYNIRLHLEGKHQLGSGYQCNKCKKYVKTRKDLSEHKMKCFSNVI